MPASDRCSTCWPPWRRLFPPAAGHRKSRALRRDWLEQLARLQSDQCYALQQGNERHQARLREPAPKLRTLWRGASQLTKRLSLPQTSAPSPQQLLSSRFQHRGGSSWELTHTKAPGSETQSPWPAPRAREARTRAGNAPSASPACHLAGHWAASASAPSRSPETRGRF